MKKLSQSPHAVDLLYGENPHQRAVFVPKGKSPIGIPNLKAVEGITLSATNLLDISRGLSTLIRIMATFDVNTQMRHDIFVAITMKHNNPWAVGLGLTPEEAIRKMVESNPEAIFGGIVIVNFKMTYFLANLLLTHKPPKGMTRVLDGLVGPEVEDGAVGRLTRTKTHKCRILVDPALRDLGFAQLSQALEHKQVLGGEVIQEPNRFVLNLRDKDLQVVEPLKRLRGPHNHVIWDLLLATSLLPSTNSNTITIVKNGVMLGNGMGQGHRGLATYIALKVARDYGHNTYNAVVATDSFYPADDGPLQLTEAKVGAVFVPSGSKLADPATHRLFHKNRVLLYTMDYKKCRMFSH